VEKYDPTIEVCERAINGLLLAINFFFQSFLSPTNRLEGFISKTSKRRRRESNQEMNFSFSSLEG
jgi:hypothetical protein